MKPLNNLLKKALLLLVILFTNNLYAQLANSGMTEEPRNYKNFRYPKTITDPEMATSNKGFEKHPELGTLFLNAPSEYCFEDLAKRTERTKTFIKLGTNGSGRYIQSSPDPMHYKDADGNWITIRPDLLPGSTKGIYEAKYQLDPLTINANENGYVKIGKEGTGLSFNRSLELIYLGNDGVELSLGNADWSHHTAGKDGAYVTNAWPGIDIEIYVLRGSAKTNFIINNALPQYANGKLVVRDHIKMDEGMSLYSSGGRSFSGNLEVRNAKSEKLFDITQAVAYEKNNVDSTFRALTYELNNNDLDIVVPGDLLDRQASSYPVIIDPFVQATNSVTVPGSTYSSNFSVGCQVINPVPIPSGMNITDIRWSFNYQTTGAGVYGTHGAVDFYVNACRSPSLPNYYWFCNVSYAVICTGNNISIFSDVQSCVLPGQCAYTQDVIMNFYRRITPGASCANISIIAASPYVVTIDGYTLALNSVTANVGTTTPVCAGTPVTLTANATYGAQPYTYTWNPGSLNGQSVTVTPTSTTTYTVTITDACGSTTTGTVLVNVTPLPNAPTVTSPVNICQNTTVPNLSSYVTGSNILWYTTMTGGVGSMSQPTINTTVVSSTTYYVSQTVNGCESLRTPIVINVIATPPTPTVNGLVSLCQYSSPPPITTYVTVGSNLLWYTTQTGGTGNSTPPNINTSIVGTTTYYVSQTVNGCESNRAAIAITIIAQPLAPTVISPVTYCQFATSSALTATGQNLLWYTTLTGGTGNSTAPIPNTSVAGTTTYYVSQTVNGCESGRASIVVNITAKPAAPAVVSPVTFCQFQAATPLGSNVTGTNILWYTAPTGGTGNSTAPVVNTSVTSTTTYYVSQTVSGCESDRTPITVIVAGQPGIPVVVSPVIYCQFETPVPLSNSVTGTNLKWYTQPTGGVGSTSAPVINTSVPGSTTYYVSQSVGSCEGPRTPITVTITPKPASPAVTTPITYCQFATATMLTATGTNLLWYNAPTGGTGSTAAPIPSTTTIGTVDYYVSQTVNNCESNRSAITVIVNPTPSAPTVVSPVTYCQYETAQPLQNSVAGTNILWYTTQTGGTGTTIAPVINTSVTSNTTYYVSQTTIGCESVRSAIQVVVGPSPQAPAVVTPITYCQNDIVQPLTNSVTGLNLKWYSVPTGGTGSAVTPVVDPSVAGTVHYYVSQGLGNCESLRSDIEVIIKPTPGLPTVITPLEMCQFDQVQLTAQGQNLLWYTQPTGGTGTPTVTPPSGIASTMSYYVSQTVNGCEGPRAQLDVTVKPQPLTPAATQTYNYCQDEPVVTLSATGTNIQWYTQQTGGTGSATAPTPGSGTVGTFHYYVTQTVNGCESPRLDITISVTPKPLRPVVEQMTLCQGAAVPPFNVQGQNLMWYNTATGGTGSGSLPQINTADTGTTDYYVSQTVNGCESDRSQIRVVINPKVEALFITDKDTICDSYPLTVTFTGTAPNTANFDWDFNGAANVTGTGAGPYTVSWNDAGKKIITLVLSNLNCSSSTSKTIYVLPTPDPVFNLLPDACRGDKVRVQAGWDQMEMPGYVWNFSGAQVLDGSGGGPYTLQWNTPGDKVVSLSLTNIPCPSLPFEKTISIHLPQAKISSVSSDDICAADSVLFSANPGMDYSYQWTPAIYFGKGEMAKGQSVWGTVRTNGYAWLTVTDRWGCMATDSVLMSTKSCCQVFLPNVFSPNGDGKNEVFRIVTKGHQTIKRFIIMNRWGKIVFETANQYEGWDGSFNGEPQDIGTYQYYLKYECADSGELMEMKGDVTLVK